MAEPISFASAYLMRHGPRAEKRRMVRWITNYTDDPWIDRWCSKAWSGATLQRHWFLQAVWRSWWQRGLGTPDSAERFLSFQDRAMARWAFRKGAARVL